MKRSQNEDPNLRIIKGWLESKYRPNKDKVSPESITVKSLYAQWDRLVLNDDILYRRWTDLATQQDILQAVVPSSERRSVLKFCHDCRTAGHLGIHKTLGRIRQSYYWPGLQRDVHSYISGCEVCTRRKAATQSNKAPMHLVYSGYPLERIATDILGELPQTANGNKYILVVADYFTKWTEAFALPNIEAKTVAAKIVEEFIVRLGVPEVMHSDQGPQYESRLFQEMCKLLDIQKTHTTPYHPQSDGMVERFNRTLTTMLSGFVNEHHTDWDVHLPYVMMAYRSAQHETTGMTPNMLMLGRETATPLDLMYEMPPQIKETPNNKWVWELQERLESAHTFVRKKMSQSMVRQKHYHDRKLKWKKFEPKERVYVYFPRKKAGTSSKFTSFWQGPFEVIKRMTDLTYLVNCGPRGSEQVIHVDRMRKKHSQLLSGEVDVHLSDNEESEIKSEPEENDEFPEPEAPNASRPSRKRKPPAWLHDYETDM